MNEIKNRLHRFSKNAPTESEISQFTEDFLSALNDGSIRCAQPEGDDWKVNIWVKEGILFIFKNSGIVDMSMGGFNFYDKSPLTLRPMSQDSGVRLVPGGSTIRNGCYVAKGVICMPPMYINIGAYIDSGSMVDSHALVGTCAQIGKNVHISAASQIGGVLEPAGALPVIIEDDVMIGGNCGVYEGVRVGKRAVLGTGTILNASTKIYDLVNERIIKSDGSVPLQVPQNAVVVPGSRTINSEFAKDNGLSIQTPLIIKYRDENTDAKTALEEDLR